MRKYHRWLSVIFGLFILFIATTGLLSQFSALYRDGGFKEEARPSAPAPAATGNPLIPAARAHNEDAPAPPMMAAVPAAFVCPETMTCRAKPDPDGAAAWVSFFHHLHSGEEFGPAGVIISIMSGFALLFFAFSGLWMYIEMYRRRSHRHSHPKRLFWP